MHPIPSYHPLILGLLWSVAVIDMSRFSCDAEMMIKGRHSHQHPMCFRSTRCCGIRPYFLFVRETAGAIPSATPENLNYISLEGLNYILGVPISPWRTSNTK